MVKKIAMVTALLLASMAASAACFQHPDTGLTYCATAAECPSGTIWQASSQACQPTPSQPVDPAPDTPATPATCTITVEYARAAPGGVYFYPLTPGCDLDGLRLALATAVAKLLAPPY